MQRGTVNAYRVSWVGRSHPHRVIHGTAALCNTNAPIASNISAFRQGHKAHIISIQDTFLLIAVHWF